LLGYFGKTGDTKPTHVLVVNLDYKNLTSTTLVGPGPMEIFDAVSGKWRSSGGSRVKLSIHPGGGSLLRIRE
jgi:hypothetical protein